MLWRSFNSLEINVEGILFYNEITCLENWWRKKNKNRNIAMVVGVYRAI